MPGTKIINVLKDDSFKDILDLFRRADAEDVVFVLPKRAALFRREDHFAAFASEAKRAKCNVSVLCANTDVNDWAKKYGFTVITKSKPTAKAAVASDNDEEVRDPNTDAYEQDVPVTSDEQLQVTDENKEEEMEGMHVAKDEEDEESEESEEDTSTKKTDNGVDEENSDLDQDLQRYGANDMDQFDEDGNLVVTPSRHVVADLAVARSLDGVRSKSGKGRRVSVPKRKEHTVKVGVKSRPAADDVPTEEPLLKAEPESDELFAAGGEPDYIDAVWKEKVSQDGLNGIRTRPTPQRKWRHLFSFGFGQRLSGQMRSSSKIKTVLVGVAVVLVLGFAAMLLLGWGKASVQIVPVARDLEFQLTVQASDAFGSVDTLFNKIPGQLFEISKSVDREFSATGSEEVAAKSRGKLTVYNEYSSSAQTLIATTRFESPDGFVFRTLQTVSVPGSKVQDGEIIPGTVEIDVIADKPGAEYNIDATSFIIPAFKEQGLTERFEKFSAKSEQAFVGGAMGLASVVTEEDMENAKAAVTDDLRTQVEQTFEAQAGDLQLLNGAQVEITDLVSTVEVDQAAETFRVSATGTLETVGFRQEDLYTLLKEHVRRNWQLVILPEEFEMLHDNIRFSDDRGVLAFDVTAVGEGFLPIDDEQIVSDIKGMNNQQVRDYFKAAEGVRASTVIFSPIWVRSVPEDPARIHLKVIYDAQFGL